MCVSVFGFVAVSRSVLWEGGTEHRPSAQRPEEPGKRAQAFFGWPSNVIENDDTHRSDRRRGTVGTTWNDPSDVSGESDGCWLSWPPTCSAAERVFTSGKPLERQHGLQRSHRSERPNDGRRRWDENEEEASPGGRRTRPYIQRI